MHSILPQESNPALRTIAKEIPIGDIQSEHIRALIEEMKTLLSKEKHGVALAASQVGEPIRLFIVSGAALSHGARTSPDEPTEEDLDEEESGPVLPDQVYINPEFVKMSRSKKDKHEGCLSIRGQWGLVPRAEKATLRAYDEHGARITRGASGFLAHIFQHEMDHLDGVLYIDKATEVFADDPEKSDE
jgi:peptide deformylase